MIEGLEMAGYFSVDSGQAMVGDPCYLDNWDTNKNDEFNIDGKEGEFSYFGACATTLRDGLYPVYVKLNDDNRVSMVVIDFEDNVEVGN